MIGKERDESLRAIAKSTGGFCFAPKTLSNALKLNELETFLCQLERPAKAVRTVTRLICFV